MSAVNTVSSGGSSGARGRVFRGSTVLLLCCFFAVAVICPLIRMLLNLGQADIPALLSSSAVGEAVLHSVIVSLTSTVIAILIAAVAAWCMTRTRVWLKAVFGVCILLPMLIPSISHGMGLIILFGSNGSLTKLLGLSGGIYGFVGIVVGSVMYAFPVAYIMISDILRYEDGTPYDAAAALGLSKPRRFSAITMPYMRKPMISVVFAVFTMIVTDYGVPLMVGGMYKTLPVLMYEEVIGGQNFGKGSFFGLILLVPAVAAFFIDMFCKSDKRSGSIARPFDLRHNRARDIIALVLLLLLSICVVYPIISFVAITFTKSYPYDLTFTMKNVANTFRKGAAGYLVNSIVIAFFTALLGTAVAFISACFTARGTGRSSRLLHLLSIMPLAIPGIVLGLSYALFFSGSFIYRTLFILILANTIHFFSSPYLMIYNSIAKLNPNLEATAASLGISRLRLTLDIFLPQTRTTLVEMFSYFFVNSMMTISAVAFLADLKTKPIALLIPQFEAQMLLEASAFVSLLILAVNLLMKGAVYLIKRLSARRTEKAARAAA